MADDLTLYKTWDGMLARQDMVKAKRDAKKATIGPLIEAAKTTRKSNIEELRELRAMLAAQMRTVRARARLARAARWTDADRDAHCALPPNCVPWQKLLPYDEFTVFGLPSNHNKLEDSGVAGCMCRDEVDAPVAQVPQGPYLLHPPAKLVKDIQALEQTLLGGWKPLNRHQKARPASARLFEPRVSPRGTYRVAADATRSSSSSRPPLSRVGAWREAGLDERAPQSVMQRIDAWRSSPKARTLRDQPESRERDRQRTAHQTRPSISVRTSILGSCSMRSRCCSVCSRRNRARSLRTARTSGSSVASRTCHRACERARMVRYWRRRCSMGRN
jgi:hypothetical protein